MAIPLDGSQNSKEIKKAYNIILISDDNIFERDLSNYLAAYDYAVSILTADVDVDAEISKLSVDVIVICLEKMNRTVMPIITRLADLRTVPGVLILTSYADEIDRIVALELGADDVVSKSISLREVLARVRALSRRYAHSKKLMNELSDNETAGLYDRIKYKNWYLNLASSSIDTSDGASIRLTRAEVQIAAALLKQSGEVISRAKLSTVISNGDALANPRKVDTVVGRLRRKLSIGNIESFIISAPGVGYFCR